MPNYRRAKLVGGTYFLTQVTHHRQSWLRGDIARQALYNAIAHSGGFGLKIVRSPSEEGEHR